MCLRVCGCSIDRAIPLTEKSTSVVQAGKQTQDAGDEEESLRGPRWRLSRKVGGAGGLHTLKRNTRPVLGRPSMVRLFSVGSVISVFFSPSLLGLKARSSPGKPLGISTRSLSERDFGATPTPTPFPFQTLCDNPRDFFMTKLVQLKRYALTPVVDLINHQSGIDSDVSYNYFYGYFAVTTQVGARFRIAGESARG